MIDTRRRSLIKLLGGISLGVTLPVLLNTTIKSEIHYELKSALFEWNRNMMVSPELFIEENKIEMMSVFELQQRIECEFKSLATMDINGLILSQTETALLAVIANQ